MGLGFIIMSKRKSLESQDAPSAGKVMATAFLDAKVVIMLDFLPKRSTITGVYYAILLDHLRIAIREKRRGKLSKGVLLQQYNAGVHTCKVAMDAVERNGYESIPHPAYSPDLAPSDFFLFPNLEKDIRGLHFRSDEEVVTEVEEWVNGKDPDFFSSGLMPLEHIGPKKKRWILTGNKLGWLLIDSPSYDTTDAQTKKNCNRRTALERSVGKLLGAYKTYL